MGVTIVITGAELDERRDVAIRIAGGVIREIGSAGRIGAEDLVLEAKGGAVIPGLHDHHVHLRATAAALTSVDVGPPAVSDRGQLRRALAGAPSGKGDWIRGVGYHESVAGLPDRFALDELIADRPVRLQHRSGVVWLLNTAALELTGAETAREPSIERDAAGRPTGRIFRGDRWLAGAIATPPPDLAPVGAIAARRGITSFTDADPHRDAPAVAHLAAAIGSACVPQRVCAMGQPGLELPAHPRLRRGPVKIVLDDDIATDLDRLGTTIRLARSERRPVAIHCVTRLQLIAALTSLGDAPRAPLASKDRIEHGAIIPPELIPELRRLELVVVTQPGFIAERGDDYIRSVDESASCLYRCRSLIDAGVHVLLSTDSPYSALDPWAAIRAAGRRQTRSGATIGPAEVIPAVDALARISGPPLRVGGPADLCILREPLNESLSRADGPSVAATVVGGTLAYLDDDLNGR